MRRSLLLAAAVVFTLVVRGIYSGQGASSVEGVVLEAGTDRPLEHVHVSFMDGHSAQFDFGSVAALAEGTTDSQGHFKIQVWPGRYRVVAALEGFVFSPAAGLKIPREPGVWVDVAAGQAMQNLRLVMARESVISGRVLSDKGDAFPGRSVELRQYRYDEYGKRKLTAIPGLSYPGAAFSFVRMDDRGDFRFYGLQTGDYYVSTIAQVRIGESNTIYYPGTADESKAIPIHVNPGEEIRLGTMALQPPTSKGVRVRLHFPDDGSLSLSQQVRFKDGPLFAMLKAPRGLIEIAPVSPGHYDVMVTIGGIAGDAQMFYSHVDLDVGDSDVDQEIVLAPAIRLSANLTINDSGKPSTVDVNLCRLQSEFALVRCNSPTSPGFYRLEIQNPPKDAYIVSAKANGEDILTDGVEIDRDTQIDVVFATPGGIVTGAVKNSKGEAVPDAVVALVPDAPLRGSGSRYRSGIADIHGNFELRGIAPGSYHLFAWPEIEGAAYRNAEFLKPFEEQGKPVRIEAGARVSMDLKLVDDPK